MASATGALQRVLLRRPPADVSAWRALGWSAEPDPATLAAEHEALCLTLELAGAEVVLAEPAGLDAIYSYDAALVSDTGVVLLRPGKEARRDEPEELAPELERAGVPVLAQLEEPALAPRVALIPEHNAATRRRLETAGVEVLVYRADELSKGEGGPTCLTLPLTRGG